MNAFKIDFKTIWANFDPNRHMRHTAYSDYAAEVRVRFFQQNQISINDFARYKIGPILFEEQTFYYKEIRIGEDISVDLTLLSATQDFDRWEFNHNIYNKKGELSAGVRVKGAWIDLEKRKLTKIPEPILSALKNIPKADNFKWTETKKS